MLEGKLAFVQNRAHGTNSKYKRATTNHHVNLAMASFPFNISMWVMLEGNAYARRKASIRSK